MNIFPAKARATAPAWKSFVFFATMLVAVSGTVQAHGHLPATGPTVTVTPVAAWQTAHPSCTVHADTDACDTTPDVWFTGSDCVPSTGNVDIATILVEDTGENCYHAYLVRSGGGTVEVVLIDP